MRFSLVSAIVLGLALPATSSTAALISYNLTLSPAQETSPVVSSGTGTAVVNYNTDTNLLDWNLVFSDLTGLATAAHFHGPALPGFNAAVVVNIGAISGLISPMIGSATITEPQETELLGGLWYVNVHTTQYPAGEIRAQVPEPAAAGLLALGGLLMARRPRR